MLHVASMTFVLLLAQAGAAPVAQTGPAPMLEQLDRAKIRIDMPAEWNGGLVIYLHGYMSGPASYDSKPPAEHVVMFLRRGFAVAQTGYSTGGWAIAEAVQDVERLRAYFVQKVGAAKETYLAGHSLGGFLTLVLLERSPQAYDGALALCAPLAPASWFMARRVFDFRVAFDYYFPNLLPSPADPRAAIDPAAGAAIAAAITASPDRAAALRQVAGLRGVDEIPRLAIFFTQILADLYTRAGGSAFDNRFTRYQGSPDDAALNAGVKRYAGEPRANAYLQAHYTPTGRIARPVLSLTTTYDPLIPSWITNYYPTVVDAAAETPLFVQAYVERSGHCAITPGEADRAFAQLLDWRRTRATPSGGLLTADGPTAARDPR